MYCSHVSLYTFLSDLYDLVGGEYNYELSFVKKFVLKFWCSKLGSVMMK